MEHMRVHTDEFIDCEQIVEYLSQLIKWQCLSSNCSKEEQNTKQNKPKMQAITKNLNLFLTLCVCLCACYLFLSLSLSPFLIQCINKCGFTFKIHA